MIYLIPPAGAGIGLVKLGSSPTLAQVTTERPYGFRPALDDLGSDLIEFLPSLLGAIAILVLGIVAAYAISWVVRGILHRTQIDDKLASMVTGRPASEVPAAKWAGDIVLWIIILLAVVGFLNALNLTVVSEPLNNFLNTVFGFIPKVFGAALILAIAWAIATVVKTVVKRGLESFNLDDRLAENTGVDPRESSVQIHETLANALYWFVFLLFLPLVLDALDLQGLLGPVQNLIDQFFAAIPQILTAALIFAAGWVLAKIARSIVTNLLMATGVDNLGTRLGLSRSSTPGSGISLSGLAGTIVYVFILVPIAITALQELGIEAISTPAIAMLNQILVFLPLLLAAGVVLAVFYFIGRFVGELVTGLLESTGFDNVLDILGLPDIAPPTRSPSTPPPSVYPPSDIGSTTVQPGSTMIQPPSDSSPQGKSPSEIVGLITLVGIVLFGAVTATEILQLEQLTLIVGAVMEIAAQVLVGVIIFAIGLYIANLVFRLIKSSSSSSSNLLAQAARVSILAFVGALALSQMGVAPNIVNLAFGLLLGAVAIAIAIAFGLGGRDVAGTQLKEWRDELKR
ncbi:MAG: mechanosensitive ion channel [Phormidesmis sp.]